MGSLGQNEFSETRFLADLRETCLAIDAPFSEEVTKKVLQAYAPSFRRGAVNWRVTDRPGDFLNFRFYERAATDTITPALEAGLLDPAHPALPLLRAWSGVFPGTVQCCDFCPSQGLVKCWLFLGGLRSVDDLLASPGVPAHLARHAPELRRLGLTRARHIAVDYSGGTVNLYFSQEGSLTGERARGLAGLTTEEVKGAGPGGGGKKAPVVLSDDEVEEMARFVGDGGVDTGVTFRISDGEITRAAQYAFLADRVYPRLDARIRTFFSQAPCYDEQPGDIVAWSFGGKRYMKGERNYCGDTVSLMRDWALPR